MFNSKKIQTKEAVGQFSQKFISYGINALKINGYEIAKASTGKQQIKLLVEGPKREGFEGVDLPDGTKSQGFIGRITMDSFWKDYETDQKAADKLVANLITISSKLDCEPAVRSHIDKSESLDDLLTGFVKIVKNKYAWYLIKGKEYLNKEGKTGVELSFIEMNTSPKGEDVDYRILVKEFAFVKSTEEKDGRIIKINGVNTVGSRLGKTETIVFDMNNKYNFEPLEKADSEENQDMADMKADLKNAF